MAKTIKVKLGSVPDSKEETANQKRAGTTYCGKRERGKLRA